MQLGCLEAFLCRMAKADFPFFRKLVFTESASCHCERGARIEINLEHGHYPIMTIICTVFNHPTHDHVIAQLGREPECRTAANLQKLAAEQDVPLLLTKTTSHSSFQMERVIFRDFWRYYGRGTFKACDMRVARLRLYALG
jgi:hypothetical protein